MKRKITEELIKWKDKNNRKPLLITGVRQCGKTYVIKEFAQNYFENYAYFNFDENNALNSIFDYDLDAKRIINELKALFYGKDIIPGKTIVIFDEIQACSKAISSLKYFCENIPELHIIAAGSLLGVALRNEGISFPVGKVDRLEMYPLSFEEFVMADDGEKYIEILKQFPLDRKIPEAYKIPMEKYLKNYYIIGGMPEVVKTWINNHNYDEVDKIQKNILRDYKDDFNKHTNSDTSNKISLIWDNIPSQIARENNKFIFSHVKSGARSKDLEDALQWLINAGLVYKLNMVKSIELPLSSQADYTYFKVYMCDVGLLRNKLNVNYNVFFDNDNDKMLAHFKGALTENYVMTELKAQDIDTFFWRSNSNAEIDFLTDYKGQISPIEVKAADNTKAKSLHLFCNKYKPKQAFKLSLKNVGESNDLDTNIYILPLYNIYRFKDYFK